MNKRTYTRPTLTRIKLDTSISMVMMSFGPGADPESCIRSLNPLRWLR